MHLPPTTSLRQSDTHRLIPSKYSDDGASVLIRIAEDDDDLAAIFDLDHATNDRLLAENDRMPGIDTHELIFGVPYYRIVNAAFCHAQPIGSRFNSPDRGAWYAAFELETAQAEVAFHKELELAEINWPDESLTYDDYLADFGGAFHDIRESTEFADCCDPASYLASQELAERLLAEDSIGIVYPSARHADGTCLACFRPTVVGNVRKGSTYRFIWEDGELASVEVET